MSQLKVWVLESISLTLSPVLHLTSCAALDQLLRCSLYIVNKMILSSGDSQPSEMAPTDTRVLVVTSLCGSVSLWRGCPA